VSVRGEGEHTSTVVVTERHGVAVRLRVERLARAVVVIDVVCSRGRSGRGASWSILARSGAGQQQPSRAPSAEPVMRPTIRRRRALRCRGDRDALVRLLDDVCAPAPPPASTAGWRTGTDSRCATACSRAGRADGSPVPLSQLAMERRSVPENVERLVMVLELCAEIAARGLVTQDEPVALVGDAS
jgi:hypothetical protein